MRFGRWRSWPHVRFYELQLPHALNHHVHCASHKMPAGRVPGVFAMGGIRRCWSAPAWSLPLAGALVYISQTRDVVLGGIGAVLAGHGMSVPLLVLSVSEARCCSRPARDGRASSSSSACCSSRRYWTVQPVIPAAMALALWGAYWRAARWR